MKNPSNHQQRATNVSSSETVQQKSSEESSFQSEGIESQQASLSPPPLFGGSGSPVQRKKNENLPEQLQSNMETSLGQDFSNVTIQKNSKQATDMNALAFAQGDSVHFAPGQFNTSSEQGKNLIGHEFAHIAQQRSGVVSPTSTMGKGMPVNDDKGLESEADDFGKKAVKGEPISKYQSAGLGMRNSLRTTQAKSNVAQLVKSNYGDFKDKSYTIIKNSAGKEIGVDMSLKFIPGKNVDAKLIGMTQSVRSVEQGTPFAINGDSTIKDRMIPTKDAEAISSPVKGTDEGIQIDQAPHNRNPLYAVEKAPGTDTKLSEGPTPGGWGQHGYRYKAGKAWKEKDAELNDGPKLSNRTINAEQLFETTALAIDGNQEGTYYGSVKWGWRTDNKGKFTQIPLSIQSQGTPSSSFLKAAEIWNSETSSSGEANLNLPVEDVKLVKNPAGVKVGLGPVYATAPFGTRVVIQPNFSLIPSTEVSIKVVDGPYTGETGKVQNSDLQDERN